MNAALDARATIPYAKDLYGGDDSLRSSYREPMFRHLERLLCGLSYHLVLYLTVNRTHPSAGGQSRKPAVPGHGDLSRAPVPPEVRRQE